MAETQIIPPRQTLSGYVKNVADTAKSFWEGMSVTLSYMFRKPITTQYPDRVPVPVRDTIPARYRGFLEVDMDICTACQACERACPIQVINIDILKGDGKTTPKMRMERFDIDIGKCMYCGLCVEPCPTGAIQHTREFEGAVMHFNNLVLRFVPDPTVPVTPYKVPKGSTSFPRMPLGEITRKLLKAWDAPPPAFPAKEAVKHEAKKAGGAADPGTLGRTLAAKALEVKTSVPKLSKVFEDAMAGTDCGDCGYADCKGYSDALAAGKDNDPSKCAPGGADSRAMVDLILVSLKSGKVPEAPGAAAGATAAPAAEAAPAPAAEAAPAGPPLAQTLSKDELFKVVLDAMAGTDCGDCEYPDCEGYSKGIVYEGQKDLARCAPGGEDTKAKLYQIMLGTKPPSA